MYINNRKGVISSIRTNIKSIDVNTKNGKERYQNLMKYFTEKFIDLELNQADEILSFAKKHNIEINPILISHPNGIAMCTSSNATGKIKVSPYISLDTSDFTRGWTFVRGHFSDVTIYLDDSYFDGCLSCVTTDTLPEHDIFLLWIFENLENTFYDESFKIPTYPTKLNCYNKKTISFNAYEYNHKFEFLEQIIENIMNKNKSKRIDTLVVNGMSVKDYIKKHHMMKYTNTTDDILHMALIYEKPFKQVLNYVVKVA